MKANKIFFDLYSTNGNMPYKEYRKWYDENDMVYIVLRDTKIYTIVKRTEMFNKGMHNGCFIEHMPYRTPLEVKENALAFAKSIGARFVSVDEFNVLENAMEEQRVRKAFAMAERMIREG